MLFIFFERYRIYTLYFGLFTLHILDDYGIIGHEKSIGNL